MRTARPKSLVDSSSKLRSANPHFTVTTAAAPPFRGAPPVHLHSSQTGGRCSPPPRKLCPRAGAFKPSANRDPSTNRGFHHPNPRRSTLVSAQNSLGSFSLCHCVDSSTCRFARLDSSSALLRFLPRRDGKWKHLTNDSFVFSVLSQCGMVSSSSPIAGQEQDRRVAPAAAASVTGVLPLDALYEILLHVPAKALHRMRAVSRPWLRLLSDPRFSAVHAACCQEPLFIVAESDFVLESVIDIRYHRSVWENC